MKKVNNKSNLIVSGLLDFLSETGQSKLLPEVTEELGNLILEAKKANVVTISSFLALTQSQLSLLKSTLGKYIGNQLPFMNKVDKHLLGGFTVRVGDWFLDASLLYYVNNIKKNLLS